MPGIFVQTVVFGAINTGVGLAEDLQKGLIERFRSLPMARSAVLAGRTLADLVRNVFVVLLMLVVGFLVGFRIHTERLRLRSAAIACCCCSRFSLSWVFAIVGLATGERRDRAGRVVPDPRPARVRLVGVRVRRRPCPAGSRVRRPPAGVDHGRRRAGAHHRRADRRRKCCRRRCGASAIIAVFAPLAVRMYRRVA